MRQIASEWKRVGVNEAAVRAALEPEADRYIEDLRKAAFKEGAERTRIMDACDDRLLNRLNDIADEHGMVGELRGQFFTVWHQIKEARTEAALAKIRNGMLGGQNQPQLIILRQSSGIHPLFWWFLIGAAVSLIF